MKGRVCEPGSPIRGIVEIARAATGAGVKAGDAHITNDGAFVVITSLDPLFEVAHNQAG